MVGQENRALSRALTKWVGDVAALYKKKIQAANIRYTGELEDLLSFGVRGELSVEPDATTHTLEGFLLLAPEWKYVEDGRRPGTFPNVEALREYVRRKPVTPKPYALPSGRTVIPTENQIAYLVGRRIKEDGIAPNPLLFETLQEMRMGLIEAINEGLSEEIRDELTLIFEQ